MSWQFYMGLFTYELVVCRPQVVTAIVAMLLPGRPVLLCLPRSRPYHLRFCAYRNSGLATSAYRKDLPARECLTAVGGSCAPESAAKDSEVHYVLKNAPTAAAPCSGLDVHGP